VALPREDGLILADTNIWLALSLSAHVHQERTRAWFEDVEGAGSIAFCRATQQSFLRLLTSAAVLSPYGNPSLANTEAWDAFEALLSDERITFVGEEPPGLGALWREYGPRSTSSPKTVDGRLPGRLRRAGGVRDGDNGQRLPAVPGSGPPYPGLTCYHRPGWLLHRERPSIERQ
jgi:toxin-antitoxin system PIN domain toxin